MAYLLVTTLLTFTATPLAFAEDGKSGPLVMGSIEAPTDGLNLNVTPPQTTIDFDSTEFVGFSSSLNGAIIDLPAESVGSRLFDLDMSNLSCVTGEKGCLRRTDMLDLGYSKSLTTKLDGKLDIQLTPRASVSFNDESSSAVVGALVRIGDDLREDSDLKSNTWYMFAGADAEAVTYAPGSVRRIASGDFHLQDRVIVGDAQAGVGYRIGEADLSLGYFRREVTSFGRELNSGSISFKEDAAALSFTWRR
jgi:hypothetical protein